MTDAECVRETMNAPSDHHLRCDSRTGLECDCYMRHWQPALEALSRLAAAEAQRDTLAEAAGIACELLEALQPWSMCSAEVRSAAVRLTVKLASLPDAALAEVALTSDGESVAPPVKR